MISLHLFCDDRASRDYFRAEAILSWPSIWGAHSPNCVHVEIYEAPKGKAWYVRSHFDIRERDRGLNLPCELSTTQWNRGRRCATLAEASREASDLWAEGVRLTLAYWRGEPLLDPGEMAHDAWFESDEHARLFAVYRDARELELARDDYDTPSGLVAAREATEQRRQAEKALHEARDAWVCSQDWREHRDVGTTEYMAPEQPRGQLALLEVA